MNGLIAYARSLMALYKKYGYVYGAQGQIVTLELLTKLKGWYSSVAPGGPSYYDSDRVKRWLGCPAADCSGLVCLLLEKLGVTVVDMTAQRLRTNCTVIKHEDLMSGDLMFVVKDNNASHVGIYDGDGYTIQAEGTDFGLVRTSSNEYSRWNTYGRLNFDIPEVHWTEPYFKCLKDVECSLEKSVALAECVNVIKDSISILKVDYVLKDGNHVITGDPRMLNIEYYKNSNPQRNNYVNGAFYNKYGMLFHSAVSGSEVIERRKIYNPAKSGSFMVMNDGTVDIRTAKITKYIGINFLVEGANLDYEENGSKNLRDSVLKEGHEEGIIGYAYHTAIGYNRTDKKVYLVAAKKMVGDDVRKLMRSLGCIDQDNNTYALLLDGGGSTKLVYDGLVKHFTDRPMNNIIYFSNSPH